MDSNNFGLLQMLYELRNVRTAMRAREFPIPPIDIPPPQFRVYKLFSSLPFLIFLKVSEINVTF